MNDLPFDPYTIDEMEMQAWCMAALASESEAEWANTLYSGVERYQRIERQIKVLQDLQRSVAHVISTALANQNIHDYTCEYGHAALQPASETVSYNAASLDVLAKSLPAMRRMLEPHRTVTYVGPSLTIH